MSSYIERVKENLFPLSIEKEDLSKAFKEWLYNENAFDLEQDVEDCQLCNHPNIRYQFEIVNKHNENELLVGSECIKRFNIAATDEFGNILNQEESRKKVDKSRRKLISDASKRRAITSLIRLSAVEEKFDIDSFIGYLQDNGAFTPNQLSTLDWRMNEHKIRHNPGDFKMKIRRDREKDQLREMEDWKIRKLWPYMSVNQQKWYRNNTNEY
uniref:Uncharacterized protein n=1 Tax=Acrobeloides nanus TaxID=290746 RepID=A0A914DHC9_9BILA